MDRVEIGFHASQILGIVRDDFISREEKIITEMLHEFRDNKLTAERAWAFIGRLDELRKYIRDLEKRIQAGARERQNQIN